MVSYRKLIYPISHLMEAEPESISGIKPYFTDMLEISKVSH